MPRHPMVMLTEHVCDQETWTLRNLDKLNPSMFSPRNMVSAGAQLTFLTGGMSAILVSMAAPDIPFFDNPLVLSCLALCPFAVFTSFIPKIFDWDWKVRYFGLMLLHLVSASLLWSLPWLCMVLYSELGIADRAAIFFAYAVPVVLWCRRFVLYYRKIFSDESLRDFLYVIDQNNIYFLQKNDVWLLEKKFKFKTSPPALATLSTFGAAYLMTPFSSAIEKLIGLPLIFPFLTVFGFTLTMMFLGLATKGFLVCYYYPIKLRKETGKEVYMDMGTKSVFLGRQIRNGKIKKRGE